MLCVIVWQGLGFKIEVITSNRANSLKPCSWWPDTDRFSDCWMWGKFEGFWCWDMLFCCWIGGIWMVWLQCGVQMDCHCLWDLRSMASLEVRLKSEFEFRGMLVLINRCIRMLCTKLQHICKQWLWEIFTLQEHNWYPQGRCFNLSWWCEHEQGILQFSEIQWRRMQISSSHTKYCGYLWLRLWESGSTDTCCRCCVDRFLA
jgi:hypothetical protein